jgi:hypothetical protein
MAQNQIHGMLGSMKAGGVVLAITEWTGSHKNDAKEGTTTKNNGFRTWVKGLESMSGSYKAIWDTLENPYILNVNPGVFADFEFHVTETQFYASNAVILDVSASVPVQDLVSYSCSYETNGTITPPGS